MAGNVFAPLIHRPRLVGAFAVGAAVAVAFAVIPNNMLWSTRAVLSWDAFCLFFIVATFRMMSECDGTKIRERAKTQDEGQHFILGLSIIAAVASLITIGAELSLAKNDHGALKLFRVLLAFATVMASWLFVQIVFALHYAHEFYGEDDSGDPHRGGLAFPGDDLPDYWDFLHFSTIIGVAGQTADVAFTSRGLRRTGTVHGMLAFVFNTVVLALTINLLAGLV